MEKDTTAMRLKALDNLKDLITLHEFDDLCEMLYHSKNENKEIQDNSVKAAGASIFILMIQAIEKSMKEKIKWN